MIKHLENNKTKIKADKTEKKVLKLRKNNGKLMRDVMKYF